MRKPKDLVLSSDQKAVVETNEIILIFDYRKLNAKSAKKLSKWLWNAALYLKTKREPKKDPVGFIV